MITTSGSSEFPGTSPLGRDQGSFSERRRHGNTSAIVTLVGENEHDDDDDDENVR
jgi:hypothetical protein